jgi:hypothetical protein
MDSPMGYPSVRSIPDISVHMLCLLERQVGASASSANGYFQRKPFDVKYELYSFVCGHPKAQ